MVVHIPELEKQLADDTDLLCHRAEVFRSKLISDFHLLDTISETGGQQEPPKFYTNDLMDPLQIGKIMKTPNSLVRFQVYSNKGEKQTTDRRNNRVKNKNKTLPPLDLWAHWVVESTFFQNFILALILINCVVLGVQGELKDVAEPWAEKIRLALEIFDYCAMMIYVIEIILKWLDNFWIFWKNRWNIFDFLITFLFFVPEIINFSTGEWGKQSSQSQLTIIANNLRSFRILRSLKMVSRFQKVRLIVLAVTKAFQAMVFITVLLFIFAYIFAIIGVIFFKDSYANSPFFDQLYYNDSFANIGKALITLFQLFTLDHWRDVYNDLTIIFQVATFPAFYIITWIAIGSFIFRNIFVGIMVNNFQSIRNDLFQEVEEIQDRERRDIEMQEFAEELDRQNYMRKQSVLSLQKEDDSDDLPENYVPPFLREGGRRESRRESVSLQRRRTRRGSMASAFETEGIISASKRRYSEQNEGEQRRMSTGRRGSLPAGGRPVRRRRYSIGAEVLDSGRRTSINPEMLAGITEGDRQSVSPTEEDQAKSPTMMENRSQCLSPTQEEDEQASATPPASPPASPARVKKDSITTPTARRGTLSPAPPTVRKRDSISPGGKRQKRDSVAYKRTFSLTSDGKIELDKSGTDQSRPKKPQEPNKKDSQRSDPADQVAPITEDSENEDGERKSPELPKQLPGRPLDMKKGRRMTDFEPQSRTEQAYRRLSLQAGRRRRDSEMHSKDRKKSLQAEYIDESVEKKDALKAEMSFQVFNSEMESADWQERVEKNFINLAKEETYYCWPRDTLFRFLLIMEALMENLHERQEIIRMINEVIIQIHDS